MMGNLLSVLTSHWKRRFVLALMALMLLPACDVDAGTLEAQLIVPGGSSLFAARTIAVTAPKGDSQHLYLANRSSQLIRVHDRNTGAVVSNFLDLPNVTGMQEGLLSLAFHPEYATNGLFYTYTYSNTNREGRVVERRRSTSNPLIADAAYERNIFTLPNNNSHNGGWIGFSPVDGYLYMTTGDGGANQGANNGLPAQDPFDVHGKVLRFDVSTDDFPADADRNYGVPASNPFATGGGAPEVFALGLRHAFRASFDSSTGDLYIGDVGGDQYEEINFLPAGTSGGQNYGWRALEGPFDNPSFSDAAPTDAIDPIYYYPHAGGASVSGGYVYRGNDIPWLQGTYFFGDTVQNFVRSFEFDGTTVTNVIDRTSELFPNGLLRPVSFGEDGLGEIYIVEAQGGAVYRIVATIPEPSSFAMTTLLLAISVCVVRGIRR